MCATGAGLGQNHRGPALVCYWGTGINPGPQVIPGSEVPRANTKTLDPSPNPSPLHILFLLSRTTVTAEALMQYTENTAPRKSPVSSRILICGKYRILHISCIVRILVY